MLNENNKKDLFELDQEVINIIQDITEKKKIKEIENKVLENLVKAWNDFVKLPSTHPDDIPDFRRSIHECQRIMATRKMRVLFPKEWITYEDE